MWPARSGSQSRHHGRERERQHRGRGIARRTRPTTFRRHAGTVDPPARLSALGCMLAVPPRYQGRIMNIHPALLPSFGGPGMYGRKVHEAVLAHGCKISGCTVNYVDIPESAQREAMLGMGMPEWQVTALLELQQYYKQGGGAKTDGVLRSLIERAPVTLDQYLKANAKEFRDQAASA